MLLLAAVGLVTSACVAQSVLVVGESPLPPTSDVPLVVLTVVDDLGVPVAGATVVARDQRTVSDLLGMAAIEWRGEPVSVSIEAAGFFSGAVLVEEFSDAAYQLELRPRVLRGTIIDPSGFALGGSTVSLGDRQVVTDENGRYELSRAVEGVLTASRPGWHVTEIDWDGVALVTDIPLAPRIIRGLHITGPVVGDEAQWMELLDIAEETVVNALVIDVKDETGRIYYDSPVKMAREIGAVLPLFDLGEVVAEMDRRDLYKIARIVAFQDPLAARARVEISAFDTATGAAYNARGHYFLDPSDPAARAYAIDLGEDVCRAGFDEIQFDYVRYPVNYPDTVSFDVEPSSESRVEAISTFLEEATARLHPLGCAVAADIFGFIASVDTDGGIGQKFTDLASTVDVLSPMIYPSHYSTGWFGFDTPNDHPGGVVGSALDDAATRLAGSAIIRPWLQDFFYNASQVREQIDQAESRAMGWMLWNALSNFEWDALESDVSPTTTQQSSGDG